MYKETISSTADNDKLSRLTACKQIASSPSPLHTHTCTRTTHTYTCTHHTRAHTTHVHTSHMHTPHTHTCTHTHTQLQSLQSHTSTVVDMIPNSNRHAQALCEHLDHILMHGYVIVSAYSQAAQKMREDLVHNLMQGSRKWGSWSSLATPTILSQKYRSKIFHVDKHTRPMRSL